MISFLRFVISLLLVFFSAVTVWSQPSSRSCDPDNPVPFSVNQTHLTVWNGQEYQPFFVKGMNLGIAVPGTFPGNLAATREQYWRWIERIHELGYNSIRLYTLHYPRMYEVLDSFNMQHPKNPIHIFQGVWLEEELPGYARDLYFLTDTFDLQIDEVVDCMHGNRVIPPRWGKAFGTYDTDVSKWVMAYIIGREVQPNEVMITDAMHAGDTVYNGSIFGLPSGSPTETWFAKRLNRLVSYERQSYQTERPVSMSSWPTLDPIKHTNVLFPDEDTTTIDLSNLQFIDAPAGYFASYHAYPYYPEFINRQESYLPYHDFYGPNSYLGYLYDLKSRYPDFPLIIAEFGTPGGWGIAHYSQSGMHHGGNSDRQQGENYIRILHNIEETNCGGGIQFAWIDEWFKRTWITDPMDYNMEDRILWHNITAAEQNFGMLRFEKPVIYYYHWGDFGDNYPVTDILASHDYAYYYLRLRLKEPLNNIDTLWLALDTYAASLGESILPSGDTVSNRAEFLLRITNFSAELYVTQAYDLYGIWHYISPPEQLYHSIPTDGAPWNIVRWKNSEPVQDIQYIGNLRIRKAELPPTSLDAVMFSNDSIDIRLPWTLLQFTSPNNMTVMHDYRNTPQREDTISDGIAVTIFHNHLKMETPSRYQWIPWHFADDVVEVEKPVVSIIEEELYLFNNNPVAVCDEYITQQNNTLNVDHLSGLLSNDFDLDAGYFYPEVVWYPTSGDVQIFPDGSFIYTPDPDYFGEDIFTYRLYDGLDHSDTCYVYIEIEQTGGLDALELADLKVYPNPVSDFLTIEIPEARDNTNLLITSLSGQLILQKAFRHERETMDVSGLTAGIYILTISGDRSNISRKLVVY